MTDELTERLDRLDHDVEPDDDVLDAVANPQDPRTAYTSDGR